MTLPETKDKDKYQVNTHTHTHWQNKINNTKPCTFQTIGGFSIITLRDALNLFKTF